ncbi:amidohydrolase family protein [Nocardia sp. SYP-A9097]|uniref:amidohydrolase n=1 Tax=Nocardia sp. SYP-A9097 TaxID=2663237 RepID=UPI00129B8410|nr:amidohydrolase [Nocardia sp. SYP-A9097]MRH89899.1 amidohydrolase family protein [Nocardia sp. SYP-A9097]
MTDSDTSALFKADRIFFNGPIVTMADGEAAPPGAVAIRGEKIVFVGDLVEAETKWKGLLTRMQDLRGAALLPGFIDAHGHMGGVGLQGLLANLLAEPDGKVGSVDDVVRTLSEWGETEVGRRSQWIVGMGYDDSLIGGHPTQEQLNAVSIERPVLAVHQSAHLGAVNDKGMELLGYAAAKRNPLEETEFDPAFDMAIKGIAQSDQAGLYVVGRKEYSRFGFTTAQDGGAKRDLLDTLRVLQNTTGWKIDLAVYLKASELRSDEDWDRLDVSNEYYRGMRLAGVKLVLDGSPQGRTAWLGEPYFEQPVPGHEDEEGYRGYRILSDEAANDQVYQAFRRDIQVIAHVNGDAAIEQFIKAVEAACARLGESNAVHRRPVAIHAQTATRSQIEAFARLGIIPSFFTMHTFYWGDWYRSTVLGGERAENISPTGWALEQGLRYTAHHDAPVALANSIAILSSQVTRKPRFGEEPLGPLQRVTVLDALKSLTINAAYQYFEEDIKGSIETGKQADLVVLNVNPLELAEPEHLKSWEDVRVLETIRRGRTRFDDRGAEHDEDDPEVAPDLGPLVQHRC